MSYRALLGTESEYALTVFDSGGQSLPLDDVARRIVRRAAARPHLPGSESGIFLPSGRLYVDVGHHPEFATAEAVNPRDGVRYSLAGDILIRQLAQEVAGEQGIDVVIRKGNVDYSAAVTWASHENYLCRRAPATVRPHLVAHLVSRVILTGSGGFDPFSTGHPPFVLSPRAMFIRQAVATSTIQDGRALVDERNQPHCAGFHRQHLMCGDALCSHLASYLRLGTTALVIALIELGLNEDDSVRLADPLAALDIVSRDVSLARSLPLANGGWATALAIQGHYLRRARACLDVLPAWAPEACDLWDDTLTRLSRGWLAVADRLDWAMKLAVYGERARQRGLRGDACEGWHSSSSLAGTHSDEIARWRAEMFEIDTRFSQIHPPGLFDTLDDAGVLRHRVAGVDDIERALNEPPPEGRAAIRGAAIARLSASGERWTCAWDRIEDDLLRLRLDLSDPFAEDERWRDRMADPESAAGLTTQIIRMSGIHLVPARGRSLREHAERICRPDAGALRREMAGHAIDFNNRAVTLRTAGRLEDAEWLMRLALALDVEARSPTHRKIAHRRNNLATVLLAQGRLDEVDHELALAWESMGTRFDLTSARVLLQRLALAMVRGEPQDLFIGQMKTHLAMQPLPDYADVTARTEVGYTFNALGPRLHDGDRALLLAILAVMNGERAVASLEEQPPWRAVGTQSLGVPWPAPPSTSPPVAGLSSSAPI